MHAGTLQTRHASRLAAHLTGCALLGALVLTGLVIVRLGFIDRLGRGGITPGTDEIVISAQQMRFGQEELHVRMGQTVTIVLDNRDHYPHSFDADPLDVHVTMPAKRAVLATFTATKPGVFDFYCGVPGHTEAGMVGTIIVEPA